MRLTNQIARLITPSTIADFITATQLNIKRGTSGTNLVTGTLTSTLTAITCTDFSLEIVGGNLIIRDGAGGAQLSAAVAANLDVNFILVQTPTAIDTDTADWVFCDGGK